jgi:hypothetical protein
MIYSSVITGVLYREGGIGVDADLDVLEAIIDDLEHSA